MLYLYKRRFLEAYDRLSAAAQQLVRAADKEIREYHRAQKAPFGLRVKKLHQGQGEAVYEARPSQELRIVWATKDGLTAFLILGNHEDVRRFLHGR